MKKITLVFLCFSFLAALSSMIYAQNAIWACSNHNPKHIATSITEIEELTRKYDCTGWYVLREASGSKE